MSANNEMPDVIWVARTQVKFGNGIINQTFASTAKSKGDTSYTRTDILEQRAKVASEKVLNAELNKELSLLPSKRMEQISSIILAALKA